jgi:hypothetical protein
MFFDTVEQVNSRCRERARVEDTECRRSRIEPHSGGGKGKINVFIFVLDETGWSVQLPNSSSAYTANSSR